MRLRGEHERDFAKHPDISEFLKISMIWKLDDDVLNIPLFMADQTDRLIGLALEKNQ